MKPAPSSSAVQPETATPCADLAADGLSHPDRGGGTDAERDHVGDRDDVDGDAVRGQRDFVEARGHHRHDAEDGAFGENLHGGGEAQGDAGGG